MKKKKPEGTIDSYKRIFFSHYFTETKELDFSLKKYIICRKNGLNMNCLANIYLQLCELSKRSIIYDEIQQNVFNWICLSHDVDVWINKCRIEWMKILLCLSIDCIRLFSISFHFFWFILVNSFVWCAREINRTEIILHK